MSKLKSFDNPISTSNFGNNCSFEPDPTDTIDQQDNSHINTIHHGISDPELTSIGQRTLPTPSKQTLAKNITLLPAISLTIGTIIGTGIFMSPKTILLHVGSIGWSLILWVFCGIYALFGGLSYLELGLMIKKSGGEYAYLSYSFGRLIGYVLVIINLLVLRPLSACLVARHAILCSTT